MDIIKYLRHYYGAYGITVGGAIALATQTPGRIYTLAPEQRRQVEDMLVILRQEYPFFKTEIKEGIMETEITFFSYQSACADGQILEHLCQWLSRVAALFVGDGQTHVTIHCHGTFTQDMEDAEFRMLNKEQDVEYKIISRKRRSLTDILFHSNYTRLALTILLVAVILWSASDVVTETPKGQLF